MGSLTLILDRLEDPDTIYGRPNANLDRIESGMARTNISATTTSPRSAAHRSASGIPRTRFPFESPMSLRSLRACSMARTRTMVSSRDVLLEGSQVAYWVACLAVHAGLDWNAFRPDLALSSGDGSLPRREVATQLRSASETWSETRSSTPEALRDVLSLVATACLSAGVDPLVLIDRDLADLSEREYLASYFSPPE